MSEQEQTDVPKPFHREGDAFIIDPPANPDDAKRQKRENEQHEFARAQVKANKRIATFNGLLVVATFCTIGVGVWQATISRQATVAATDATKAAIWSAYWSCLGSQASQNMFSQAQSSTNDSHSMAAAAIQQAAAEIQSARANPVYMPRLPEAGDIMGTEFGIFESIGNIGKGDARDVMIKNWAVLVRTGEHLRFANRSQDRNDLSIGYFPAGHSLPEKAEPPHGQLNLSIFLRDMDGKIVTTASADAQDLLKGRTIAYVFGNMTYTDIAGFHAERFCQPVWIMQRNTRRDGGTTDNERKCNRYNRNDASYSYKPLAPPTNSGSTISSNITCVKPTN